ASPRSVPGPSPGSASGPARPAAGRPATPARRPLPLAARAFARTVGVPWLTKTLPSDRKWIPAPSVNVQARRASGGIGRRAGFRFLCPKGCGGSSPPSPTTGERASAGLGLVVPAAEEGLSAAIRLVTRRAHDDHLGAALRAPQSLSCL